MANPKTQRPKVQTIAYKLCTYQPQDNKSQSHIPDIAKGIFTSIHASQTIEDQGGGGY